MTNSDLTHVCEIDPSKIERLDLPEPTKKLLASSRLPKAVVDDMSFSSERGTFPTLDLYCLSHNLPQIEHGEMFYRIGTDGGCQMCLTRGNGYVVAIDPNGRYKQRFVNSSIEKFLKIFDMYMWYSVNVQSMREADAVSLVAATKAKMREVDSDAFVDPDSWWPCITDQMGTGML